MDVEELRRTLEGFGQSHLLEHWEDLSSNEQQHLYDDLQSIPYGEMASIFDRTMNPKNGHSVTSGKRLSFYPPQSVQVICSWCLRGLFCHDDFMMTS